MKDADNKRIFRHYKGNRYEFIGIAKDVETEEEFVVYRSMVKERQIWIRAKHDFFDTVVVNDKIVHRFQEMVLPRPQPYRK